MKGCKCYDEQTILKCWIGKYYIGGQRMKGWKWNRNINDWDIVEVNLSKDFGKVKNAIQTETLLPRAEVPKSCRQRRKLLLRSSKAEKSRL